MGNEIFEINDGKKAAQLLIVDNTASTWTSIIRVQGHQRLNVGIMVGDQISEILLKNTFSATISALASIFSGTITLQRRYPEEDEVFQFRDVDNWAVNSSGGGEGGSENITAYPDPETVEYRLGLKAAADYTGGITLVRLGTS